MISLQNFLKVIKGIYQNKSLCRILQNLECEKIKISGQILEFGAEPLSKKNFSSIAKKKSKVKIIHYSDKHLKKKGVIYADLNKKTFLKKIFMIMCFFLMC